jgi:repressor LexA
MDDQTPAPDELTHKRGRPPGSKNSLRELPDGPVDEMTGLTQRQ